MVVMEDVNMEWAKRKMRHSLIAINGKMKIALMENANSIPKVAK